MAVTANNSRQRRQTRGGLSRREEEEASRTAVAEGPDLADVAPVKLNRLGWEVRWLGGLMTAWGVGYRA
jgi:hypothetical protein